ncbi:hypothetical protein B843_01340 [Corynebacterium vitaeruminis DSM 20294]|uniref:Nucleoid-associated protein B843_01340 n=2 Tax=Corynebacterium vitaeruminis TaxID=38305 RepID=W5XY83_9CORY|nr:hypothetical protein B843_01340 [Corynebacterium vitaeruminis DSM 20294]
MSQILAQAQAMQAQLQEAQREILASTVTGTAGNGLVSLDMTGDGKVAAVRIDPQVVDPEDIETLQDLIVGAFSEAHGKLASLAEQKMGPLSQGFDSLNGMF